MQGIAILTPYETEYSGQFCRNLEIYVPAGGAAVVCASGSLHSRAYGKAGCRHAGNGFASAGADAYGYSCPYGYSGPHGFAHIARYPCAYSLRAPFLEGGEAVFHRGSSGGGGWILLRKPADHAPSGAGDEKRLFRPNHRLLSGGHIYKGHYLPAPGLFQTGHLPEGRHPVHRKDRPGLWGRS